MDDSETENDLVIATSASRVLVRIKSDGTLIYGPDYTPEEAATVFWRTLARKRIEADKKVQVREVFCRHMETLLIEAGEADLANEAAQRRESELAAVTTASQKAERMKANLDAARANTALNDAALKLIELGRRLVLRDAEDPGTQTPEKDPSTLN